MFGWEHEVANRVIKLDTLDVRALFRDNVIEMGSWGSYQRQVDLSHAQQQGSCAQRALILYRKSWRVQYKRESSSWRVRRLKSPTKTR